MVFPPADFSADEAGLFERAEMLRDRVEGYVERFGELRHGRASCPQTSKDRSPLWVTEHREGSIQSSVIIFNHWVEYNGRRSRLSTEKMTEPGGGKEIDCGDDALRMKKSARPCKKI